MYNTIQKNQATNLQANNDDDFWNVANLILASSDIVIELNFMISLHIATCTFQHVVS